MRSLFLGKNKITKIENLDGLTGLRTLSIQSASFPLGSARHTRQQALSPHRHTGNRLTKIEGLDSLTALEELYLSHNGLTKIEGLRNLVRDLALLSLGRPGTGSRC